VARILSIVERKREHMHPPRIDIDEAGRIAGADRVGLEKHAVVDRLVMRA
jgi:hypothetical protein